MAPVNCTKVFQSNNCSAILAQSKPCVQSIQAVTVVLLVSAVILFILLILRDALTGLKVRAHWIPGDFLVLSALTIQLLNLISTQGQPLKWEKRDILLVEFWMIHTSRVMLCIVIGYLMPAMANPGAEDFWGKIVSLTITVFLHVISELYFINPKSAGEILKSLWPRQQGTSITLYYILAGLMFSSFVLLLFLLACSNIAGRGVERIVAKKIPLIVKVQMEEDHQNHKEVGERKDKEDHLPSRCQECWQRVEDSVLQAWIVARVYSLDYVIARSAFASAVSTIVTVQIAITIIARVRNSPNLLICTPLDKLRFSITMMQCVFILIGWFMILWRWTTAVTYYGNWSSCCKIEDFWTRHLRELQEKDDTQPQQAQLLQGKITKLVVNQSTKLTLNKYLLYPVIWVQSLTVSFSKACFLGSRILFHNAMTGKLLSSILFKRRKVDYSLYYKGILEGVKMLGESPENLWLSNCQSIPLAKKLILQGRANGEQICEHLVHFLGTKTTRSGLGLRCLDPFKRQPGLEQGSVDPNKTQQKVLKYVCQKRQDQEEHLTNTSTESWKMTAVSLLAIIVHLSPMCNETDKERASTSGSLPPSVSRDCLKAYSEAWEIIDFIDRADIRSDETTREAVDEITSEAGDKYFATVRRNSTPTPPRSVVAALGDLKRQCGLKAEDTKEGLSKGWTGNDSTDWKAEEWGSAVYKLCNSIECNKGTDVNDLLKELESCLADIINECLQQIQRLLLLNCRKWALKNNERKIAKALYATGKARKIMEVLRGNTVVEGAAAQQ